MVKKSIPKNIILNLGTSGGKMKGKGSGASAGVSREFNEIDTEISLLNSQIQDFSSGRQTEEQPQTEKPSKKQIYNKFRSIKVKIFKNILNNVESLIEKRILYLKLQKIWNKIAKNAQKECVKEGDTKEQALRKYPHLTSIENEQERRRTIVDTRNRARAEAFYEDEEDEEPAPEPEPEPEPAPAPAPEPPPVNEDDDANFDEGTPAPATEPKPDNELTNDEFYNKYYPEGVFNGVDSLPLKEELIKRINKGMESSRATTTVASGINVLAMFFKAVHLGELPQREPICSKSATRDGLEVCYPSSIYIDYLNQLITNNKIIELDLIYKKATSITPSITLDNEIKITEIIASSYRPDKANVIDCVIDVAFL